MQVASRFSIGVHILSLLGSAPEADNTSEWMASSIGVNAVIVRNITGMLRRAGLVATRQGVAGTHLAKQLREITLLDVYRAVQAVEEDLFAMHPTPNPKCPVGACIQATLEREFTEAQQAMEARLGKTTMEDIVYRLRNAALTGDSRSTFTA
jgi:DNA-binding IscR family transcriptional regulator